MINASSTLADLPIKLGKRYAENWIKVEVSVKVKEDIWKSFLEYQIIDDALKKAGRIRLSTALTKENEWNDYAFYIKLPGNLKKGRMILNYCGRKNFEAISKNLKVSYFRK